jgi:hypothetical protein
MYLWLSKADGYQDEIRVTMAKGVEKGLVISNCDRLPIGVLGKGVLPVEPKVPPQPFFSFHDPLSDKAVTLAQRQSPP